MPISINKNITEKDYGKFGLSTNQVGLSNGDHVAFDQRDAFNFENNNIVLDISTSYTTTINADSKGRFLLKANKLYSLKASISLSVSSTNYKFGWYNSDANTQVPGQIESSQPTVDASISDSIQSISYALFQPLVDTRVELRAMSVSASAQVNANLSWAEIETVTENLSTVVIAGGSALSLQEVILSNDSISSYDLITTDGLKADSSVLSHLLKIAGIATTAIPSSTFGYFQYGGVITNPSWTFTINAPVYLNGTSLSSTPPTSGFVMKIGIALSATKLLIEIGNIESIITNVTSITTITITHNLKRKPIVQVLDSSDQIANFQISFPSINSVTIDSNISFSGTILIK